MMLPAVALAFLIAAGAARAEDADAPVADDDKRPDAGLHLGLGAGVAGGRQQAVLVSGESTYQYVYDFGVAGALQLRTPRGLTLEPILQLEESMAGESPTTGDSKATVVELGLLVRPRLASSGSTELQGIAGMSYGYGRTVTDADTSTPTVVHSHSGGARLGMGLLRWLDPQLSLGADLSVAGFAGTLSTVDDSEAHSIVVSLDPTARLILMLWL